MKIEVKNIFPFTLLCEWFTEKNIFSATAFLSAWYNLNNHNDRCTINVPISATNTITEPRFSPYIWKMLPTHYKTEPIFLLWWILKILNMKEKGQKQKKKQPLGKKTRFWCCPHLNPTLREEESTKQCMSTLKERKYYSFHDIVVSDITWSLLFNHK